MSYKPEVEVDGKFSTNALRFATHEEALASAKSLFSRWTLTTGYRASPSDDPVTCKHENGRDVFLPLPAPLFAEVQKAHE